MAATTSDSPDVLGGDSLADTTDALTLQRQRDRFAVMRLRAFAAMAKTASPWKVAASVPYYVSVLVTLFLLDFPLQRLGVQAASYVALFTVMLVSHGVRLGPRGGLAGAKASTSEAMTVLGVVANLVAIGNTGGLASPLLVTGVIWILGIAVAPVVEERRGAWIGGYCVGLFVLALACHVPLASGVPLVAPVALGSAGYVVLAMLTMMQTSLVLFAMGHGMTCVYERVALEVASRREEMFRESAERTRSLEGIAARLAHEVKNPLAAIKGLSMHLARGAQDTKQAERLSIVASEADRLQQIVDGFLSFSRGLEDLKVCEVRPYELGRELSLLLETPANESGVVLEVRGSPEVPLNADPRKLRQIMLNFLLNAIQASPRGGTVTLEVAAVPPTGDVEIRVVDRGAGMSPEILARIQKPYFTTKAGGSGLGIAVARGLVEQHGGTLRIESTVGVGTTVAMTLPRCALRACGDKTLPTAASCEASARAAE